ncbi:hypothetical protein NQ527_09975 [Eshraghiella crossota]|nr:hypothetical protein [Butyrivibrio crossotus]UWO50254.1 hypothetical protein NQ527_09975 [Butyrivibrio crossotus]
MNWIKENKIKIIIIAVAVVLLAGIGTVIALNTKQTKIDPADSNQSDVVINESSKEDVTTKKDDVIKESESTTEADKEEETTSKDDKNVEEETTPAAAEPTTPYVAPTTKPQAKPTTPYVAPTTKPQAKPTTPYVAPTTKPQTKPTKPQAKPTKPQPTRPTEPATTAPVIHGKDGVILDTLYICKSDGSKIKFPESKKEMEDRLGKNHFYGIWHDDAAVKDILGIGLIMNQSTKEDVEAYFGKSSCEKDTENGMVMQYNYKNTDIYVTFNFFKDTGKIRIIFIDGDKGLDTY